GRRGFLKAVCLGGEYNYISSTAFLRMLYAMARGYVKGYDCSKYSVVSLDDSLIPVEELDEGDWYAVVAPLKGWRYDWRERVWVKNGVRFRHMHYFTLEIFERGVYSNLNVENRDVVDVGAFVGDTAIYFASRGARRVIA
ncbi:MAG: hypothetical protein QW387_07290, partial [Desulfurococcus sp.]